MCGQGFSHRYKIEQTKACQACRQSYLIGDRQQGSDKGDMPAVRLYGAFFIAGNPWPAIWAGRPRKKRIQAKPSATRICAA